MKKKTQIIKKGKWWFRIIKKLTSCKYKAPEFIYLGEEFANGSILISNHEGTDAPMSLEMYMNKPIRFWGAHEMNSGLVKMYKYQSRVYYHEKKHWNLLLARLFCLIASPLTNLFYKGLNLISTYKDTRFFKTVKESFEAVRNGDSIVVFPENSEKGYLKELEGFFSGFLVFAEYCYKKGIDVPIVVTYFQKEKRRYVIDAPIKYSALLKEHKTKEDIADKLLKRCNELGKMDFDKKEERQD